MSKLLINESPFVFQPTLAARIGLNEAIMLQQIQYWISHPHAIIKEGKRWHYDTYKNWQIQFPFWSVMTIRRIAESLKEQNLVITKKFNARSNDQTLWYTINYDELAKKEFFRTLALAT